jgi:NAD(P)-dependent dehydrogenase (short-subunit alcohol dehydrogenase family)
MIIISGASRGIGKFLSDRFSKENLDFIGIYNKTIPVYHNQLMYQVDISDAEAVSRFVKETDSKLNNIVLINCAGANYNAFAHKANPHNWADIINVNLNGTFNMINACLPKMREQGYGRIINCSSIVAQVGIPGTSAYAASKSGLWGMSRTIAIENANKGITINNINLGYFNIGMSNEFTPEERAKIIEKIPMKKLGEPEEILLTIKFLINSKYITGSSIDINGGLF